ncbi:hypothetical protein AB2B38_008305 [Balneola sp. MJW-20]|uniref:hypothetical protein n=1 Tax=Gracilimonas aurantiaca TaxID=3234185 RepID=UPI0034671A4B
MITLFRRIRQKLIESGSVTRYLLYAMGEIALVMIGILLALQVNNWNEERRLLISAEDHLQLLESNLQDDYQKLISLKNEVETSLESSENLMERYKQNMEADIDSMMFELTQLIFEFNFSPDKSAMDILVNSGELGVLPDAIREQISQYYNSAEYIEERDEISNSFIKNQYEVVVLNNYSSFWTRRNSHPALAIYNDDQRDPAPVDPQVILKDKRLETMVFARSFQLRRQQEAYQEGKVHLETLIQTLKDR